MTEPLVEDAYDYMRTHLAGRLRFDADRIDMRVAPAPDGTLIASVMVAMLRAVDTVLELPDDSADSMEVQVTLAQIDENGPDGSLCDRWSIYHGDPPDVRWARMHIDAARYKGHFIDGIALARANSFAAQEAALCREINAQHAGLLGPAVHACGGHKMNDPRLVGVDPWGFDVRGHLGVARVVCRPPMARAEDALPRLRELGAQG